MFVNRQLLIKLLGPAAFSHKPQPGKFGDRNVTKLTPQEVKTLVADVKTLAALTRVDLQDKKVERLTESHNPANLIRLRRSPFTKLAVLTSLIHDLANNHPDVTPDDFDHGLKTAGLGIGGNSPFSPEEQVQILRYLQQEIIPQAYGILTDKSHEAAEAAEQKLAAVGESLDRAEQAVHRQMAKDSDSDEEYWSTDEGDNPTPTAPDKGGKTPTQVDPKADHRTVDNAPGRLALRAAEQVKRLTGWPLSEEHLARICAGFEDHQWADPRLVKELAWFTLCQCTGAPLQPEDFVTIHKQGVITDQHLAVLDDECQRSNLQIIQREGIHLCDAVRKFSTGRQKAPVVKHRSAPSAVQQHSPPLPSRRTVKPVAAPPSVSTSPLAVTAEQRAELVDIVQSEREVNILLRKLKSLKQTVLDKLKALYNAMWRTKVHISVEHVPDLIEQGMVNKDKLEKHPYLEMRRYQDWVLENNKTSTEQVKQSKVSPPAKEVGDRKVTQTKGADPTVAPATSKPSQTAAKKTIPDWVNRYYPTLSQQKDEKGKPLVSSAKECLTLLEGLELRDRPVAELVTPLKHFRRLQAAQHLGKVVFTNPMFASLVRMGELQDDPLVPSFQGVEAGTIQAMGGREAFIKATTPTMITNLHDLVTLRENFRPEITADMNVRKSGFEPARAGLHNYCNNCFMNSTLQATADAWQASGVLDQLRNGRLPETAMFSLLDALTPIGSGKAGASREQSIKRQAKELSENPDRVDQLGLSPEVIEGIAAYRELADAFINLSDGLNQPPQPGEQSTLVDAQIRFLDAYKRYGDVTGNMNILMTLGAFKGEKLVYGSIKQQDPDEFYGTLGTALGLDRNPMLGMEQKSRLSLYRRPADGDDGPQLLDSRSALEGRMSSKVACAVHGKSLQETLDFMVIEEELSQKETVRWEDERLLELGEQQDASTYTTRAMELSAPQPPQQVAVQIKLYSYRDNDGNLLEKPRYLREEGKSILKNLPKDGVFQLPFSPDDQGGESQAKQKIPYKIRSAVCHRGGTLESGHYVTLLFKGDDILVCDDGVVLTMADYGRYRDGVPFTSLEELCEKDGLSPYMVTGDKVEK